MQNSVCGASEGYRRNAVAPTDEETNSRLKLLLGELKFCQRSVCHSLCALTSEFSGLRLLLAKLRWNDGFGVTGYYEEKTEAMEKRTYAGWLEERDHGEADDILFLSGTEEPLAEILEWMAGKQVCVRYWITDKHATADEAQEEFMNRLMGAADVKFLSHYSDVTGYLWTDEDLNVGGHDLLREFRSSLGKWLILEVEEVTSNVQGDRQCAASSRSVQRPKGARSTEGLGITWLSP